MTLDRAVDYPLEEEPWCDRGLVWVAVFRGCVDGGVFDCAEKPHGSSINLRDERLRILAFRHRTLRSPGKPQKAASYTKKIIKALIHIVNSVGFEYSMTNPGDNYDKTCNS